MPPPATGSAPEPVGAGTRARSPGVGVLAVVAAANVLLWVLARPPGQPDDRYLGELVGAEAILLFSCSLVLMTLLRPIERAFGGLDRVALWHRRTAVAGAVLLLPHVALATSSAIPDLSPVGTGLGDLALLGIGFLVIWALAPGLHAARWHGLVGRLARATYERWLTAHRLTGIFVAAALAHAAVVDPVLDRSTVLRVAFVVTGTAGVCAYLYREFFASRVLGSHTYRVGAVNRAGPTALEVGLDPAGEPIRFTAGQFVVVSFGGLSSWQRHPFSVSSAPSQPRLELAIRANGDYTKDLYDQLRPGLPAKVVGPFGGFDYRAGGHDQIWIAGGIGITPFASWIRSIGEDFDRDVDLYYTVHRAQDALYRDELEAVAARCPTLRTHIVSTDQHGVLKAFDVLRGAAGRRNPWVYMCGPPAMVKALDHDLQRAGVPAGQIRWENFALR
ncbi:MAG TPA: ferredoxin reductase family protein [Solirubrobacteraceae bacterium]|nr:ferredoxin reductase family protein [Solirubrobacteraceae bacterium]